MAGSLLSLEQISLLEQLAEKNNSLHIKHRAKILLLYHAGKGTSEIAETVGLSERTVQHWRREFLKRDMDIFPRIETESVVDTAVTPLLKEKTRESRPMEERYPRVRKNPGIKADDSMAEAGRKILRFHFARMIAHEEGTRLGEDIEELHDMRVATRRMRAAFDVFGPYFKPKVVKTHLKGLRATGRALGRVRDLDVFMQKAQHYLESLPETERSGLDPLLNAWAEERASDRDRMLAHLDGEAYQNFKHDFNEFVSTPGAGVGSDGGKEVTPYLVRQLTPVLIYTRLAGVRAYETVVTNAVIEQLHALRIEFKKLRYTVEYFREVLGDEAGKVIVEIKVLQDHLGDLNDANVACQILRDFIESWEERQSSLPLQMRENPEPVVAYLAAKHAERHQLMVTFPGAWAHFNRPEFRMNLALSISVL